MALFEVVAEEDGVSGYSTREVGRILGVPAGKVRTWVRHGLVVPGRGPRGSFRFDFRDLVLLRTAQQLSDGGIAPRRIAHALDRLRDQLPEGRSLTGVRVAADGERVVVQEGGEWWEPESGQRRLDFDVRELAEQAAPIASRRLQEAQARADELDSEAWFELAVDLETTSPPEAMEAYRRTLEAAPDHPDAHLNLGRLLHETGRFAAAERHYRQALVHRPDDVTAAFNLGVALQDRHRWHDAVVAYRQALAVDPGYADAYFNLAAIFEKLGERAEAIQALQRYRKLVGDE